MEKDTTLPGRSMLDVKDLGLSKEFCECFDSFSDHKKIFWTHYLLGGCKSKKDAAVKAGYEGKNARVMGSAIYCSAQGRKLMGLFFDEMGITGQSLLADLHQMNATDIADYEPVVKGEKTLRELRDEGVDTRQIRKYKIGVTGIEIGTYDRLKSIETMAKIRKLYEEGSSSKVTVEVLVDRLNEQATQITTRPEDVEAALNGGADDSDS